MLRPGDERLQPGISGPSDFVPLPDQPCRRKFRPVHERVAVGAGPEKELHEFFRFTPDEPRAHPLEGCVRLANLSIPIDHGRRQRFVTGQEGIDRNAERREVVVLESSVREWGAQARGLKQRILLSVREIELGSQTKDYVGARAATPGLQERHMAGRCSRPQCEVELAQPALPTPIAQEPPKPARVQTGRTRHDLLPFKGMVIVAVSTNNVNMNPRFGLLVGALITAGAALVLAFAPVGWLASLLDVSSDAVTTFLLRRYGASATAALFAVVAAVERGATARRAALLGLATWFAVQGSVAVWGIVSGTVGGLAWLAMIADPLIAAWFFVLSVRDAAAQP